MAEPNDADAEIIDGAVEYCRRLTCRSPIIRPARGRPKLHCNDECRRVAERDYRRAVALLAHLEATAESVRHEIAAYGRDEIEPEASVAEQRVTEATIRAVLADTYTPDGIDIWLDARNINLNGWRPASLLEFGGESVLAEAERVAGAM